MYSLNFAGKASEIVAILKNAQAEGGAAWLEPSSKELEGLREVFREESNARRSSRGFYYFCTSVEDPDCWVALIKTKPGMQSYRVNLGSTKDRASRIMRIWGAALRVSRMHRDRPFIRKWVENVDQEACGNNRLPSKSAFRIFVHLGWLEVVGAKGRVVFYRVSRGVGSRRGP